MTKRLLVRDLMTVGVKTCSPDTPIVEVTRLLLDEGLEGLAVLDQEGHAVGTVSRDELVQAYARDNCRQLTAEAINDWTTGVLEHGATRFGRTP